MTNNVIIDESAKQILAENLYKGKGYINTLDPVPVETYAEMQVSRADTIVPENIKKEVEILGVEGAYEATPPVVLNSITVINKLTDSRIYIQDSKSYVKHIQPNQYAEVDLDDLNDKSMEVSPDILCNAKFYGKYRGNLYENINLKIYDDGKDLHIVPPNGQDTTWEFLDGDFGTLTVKD